MDASTDMTGKAIVSADGDDLGRVKEVRGGYFEVDIRMKPDFWLSSQYVTQNREVVMLSLRKGEIDEHKLDAPGLEQTTAATDGIISQAEALTQRERMERELALQNSQLPR